MQVAYYEDFTDSQAGINEILTPNAFLIAAPPLQTIFVRIEDIGGICFALEDFTINYSQPSVTELTDAPQPIGRDEGWEPEQHKVKPGDRCNGDCANDS